MTLTNLQTRDVETLIHPYTNQHTIRETGTLVIERGKGVFVYDTHGKGYIEGLAGLWCTALGYGNEELADAAHAQMCKLPFSHLFGGKSHDPAIDLAEKLKEIAPVPISKVFFVCSGSEANDSQIKMIWYMNNALGRPDKKKIIGRVKGYHGVTIASASLTGLPYNHMDFDLPIDRIIHTSCPHHYRFAHEGETELEFSARCAAELEELILREGPDTVAAFFAEPVMGAGGVISPPQGYFEAIMPVCQKYDVYMVADEVICGFGRLGEWFGSTAVGYKPHAISVAKALTSAYMPVGAVLIPEQMHEALVIESKKLGTFGHGFTYSGHPVGCAVALKTLEIYRREDIVNKVAGKAPLFWREMARLGEHPLVGEVRGKGLLGGVELVADKKTRQSFDPKKGVGPKAVAFMQEEGLLSRAVGGDTLGVCPPLIITEEEIIEMFARMKKGLDRTLDWAKKEGLV